MHIKCETDYIEQNWPMYGTLEGCRSNKCDHMAKINLDLVYGKAYMAYSGPYSREGQCVCGCTPSYA